MGQLLVVSCWSKGGYFSAAMMMLLVIGYLLRPVVGIRHFSTEFDGFWLWTRGANCLALLN
jgi:hypothetical protein